MDTVDMVNSPNHYKQKANELEALVRDALLGEEGVDPVCIECFEAMISMMTIDEIRGYLRGNSFKYRWRYTKKAGVQDLEKAAWYEKKLLSLERVVRNWSVGVSDELC